MPTNANAYNSRVTDESLEKRFRDTFRAQGGAELVDDLYASGVIVPVVDFTAAATGQQVSENLQTAWDFTTGFDSVTASSSTIISNAGFWQIGLTCTIEASASGTASGQIQLSNGLTAKPIWSFTESQSTSAGSYINSTQNTFVVFVRGFDTVIAEAGSKTRLDVWYRQIATSSGDAVLPSGFTSS